MIELEFISKIIKKLEVYLVNDDDKYWNEKLKKIGRLWLRFSEINNKTELILGTPLDLENLSEREKLLETFQMEIIKEKRLQLKIEEDDFGEINLSYSILNPENFEELIDIDIPPSFNDKTIYFERSLKLDLDFFRYLLFEKLKSLEKIDETKFYYNKIFQIIVNLANDFNRTKKKSKDAGKNALFNSNTFILTVLEVYLSRYYLETQSIFLKFIDPIDIANENKVRLKLFNEKYINHNLRISEHFNILPFQNKLAKGKYDIGWLKTKIREFINLIHRLDADNIIFNDTIDIRLNYLNIIILLEKMIIANIMQFEFELDEKKLNSVENKLNQLIMEKINDYYYSDKKLIVLNNLASSIKIELIEYVDIIGKKYLEYTNSILLYIQNFLENKIDFDYKPFSFYNEIVKLCSIHQTFNQTNRLLKDENKYNSFLRTFLNLHLAKYNLIAHDQTLLGQNTNFKNVKAGKGGEGEIDFAIKKSDDTVYTIMEAFILSGLNTLKIQEHLRKIFYYDANGLNFLVILVYVQDDSEDDSDFKNTYEKYKEYLFEEEYKKEGAFKYKIIEAPEEMKTNYSNIKTIITKHKRIDTDVEIFHIIYKVW